MGKGDHRRPLDVDKEVFDNNWDKIFGKVQDDEQAARQALSDHLKEIFSAGGIEDIEEMPGSTESDQEARDSGHERPTPHVEGS